MKTSTLLFLLSALAACQSPTSNVGTTFRASMPVVGEVIFE